MRAHHTPKNPMLDPPAHLVASTAGGCPGPYTIVSHDWPAYGRSISQPTASAGHGMARSDPGDVWATYRATQLVSNCSRSQLMPFECIGVSYPNFLLLTHSLLPFLLLRPSSSRSTVTHRASTGHTSTCFQNHSTLQSSGPRQRHQNS